MCSGLLVEMYCVRDGAGVTVFRSASTSGFLNYSDFGVTLRLSYTSKLQQLLQVSKLGLFCCCCCCCLLLSSSEEEEEEEEEADRCTACISKVSPRSNICRLHVGVCL